MGGLSGDFSTHGEEDVEDREGGGESAAGGESEEDEEEAENDLEKGRQELRMRQMRQKKERLSYVVERLTLQAGQRERQLRQSVARE